MGVVGLEKKVNNRKFTGILLVSRGFVDICCICGKKKISVYTPYMECNGVGGLSG